MSVASHLAGVYGADELSTAAQEPTEMEELIAHHTGFVTELGLLLGSGQTARAERLVKLAAHQSTPAARLNDRDWDFVHDELLDKLDADFVSDVADISKSDAEIGKQVRRYFDEIVLNRLGR